MQPSNMRAHADGGKILASGLSWSHAVSAATAVDGTAQHSAAQHSTAQHSTAQHSTAQHSTAQHSTAQPRFVFVTACLLTMQYCTTH